MINNSFDQFCSYPFRKIFLSRSHVQNRFQIILVSFLPHLYIAESIVSADFHVLVFFIVEGVFFIVLWYLLL